MAAASISAEDFGSVATHSRGSRAFVFRAGHLTLPFFGGIEQPANSNSAVPVCLSTDAPQKVTRLHRRTGHRSNTISLAINISSKFPLNPSQSGPLQSNCKD